MEPPDYSIVVPAYNEEETLPELTRRLTDVMDRLDGPTELIFVDDGSTDGTFRLMTEAARRERRLIVIQLSRNFGHQVAITAGLDHAAGRAVVVMDADLQDPPEIILELAERWREGYEVVYGVRRDRRGESAFKRWTARVFYRALRRLTKLDMPADVGDFRLVDRKALNAFMQMRETNRYVRGMFHWIGFRQVGIPYTRDERYAGTTKYPLRRMIKFAVDAIVGFSTAPLRLSLNLGFILAACAFLAGVAVIVAKLAGAFEVPGWASLAVGVTFLGGVQLWMIGMMGEYISRIHDEVRNRPLYFVREIRGYGEPEDAGSRDAEATRGSSAPSIETARSST